MIFVKTFVSTVAGTLEQPDLDQKVNDFTRKLQQGGASSITVNSQISGESAWCRILTQVVYSAPRQTPIE